MADTQSKPQWTPPQGNSSQFGVERPTTLTQQADKALKDSDGAVRPNAGASLLDTDALGDRKSAVSSEWQKERGIDTSKQIKLVKVAHMRYQHPDLATITKFLQDFGMHIVKESEDKERLWFGGYGSDQYVYYAQKGEKKFLGGCLEVESYAELEKASKLPGASDITQLTDAPGGGHMLTITDPAGFPVNLIHGQRPADRGDYPDKLLQNYEVEKPRVRKFNRFTPGPAAVHKLGHYGYTVTNFEEMFAWYTSTFNLVPSDILYVNTPPENKELEVACFMHIDRGSDPTDHHTVFMAQGSKSHVHHASFEVHDFDTQNLGHQWLGSQGYTSVWGVGRHILGSQIFDYWWDTTGNMIEHYADGDLVNWDTPVGWMHAGDESLAVWGPEVPKWFLD
jgi:hypothetical protein